jgi:OOP family OmpA-OmpF porin
VTRRRLLYLLPLFVLLSACEYRKLEELRTAEPSGTTFQKALWNNYRALSMDEEKAYDWAHAVMYAIKALDSAYGNDVAPEMVENWDIPADIAPTLAKARVDLMIALTSDAKDVQPQLLADAQTNFDCWLEQQQEGWQEDDIAHCREGFYNAMHALSPPLPQEDAPKAKPPAAKPRFLPKKKEPVAAAEPSLPPVETAPQVKEQEPAQEEAKKEEPSSKAKNMETASYIVFFQADDIALDTAAQTIVEAAAQSVASRVSYRVVINADTDNSDSAKLDPELPVKRAAAIKAKLVESGVKESAIDILASGEEKSAAKTLFSPTPVERQVEIFITE